MVLDVEAIRIDVVHAAALGHVNDHRDMLLCLTAAIAEIVETEDSRDGESDNEKGNAVKLPSWHVGRSLIAPVNFTRHEVAVVHQADEDDLQRLSCCGLEDVEVNHFWVHFSCPFETDVPLPLSFPFSFPVPLAAMAGSENPVSR